VNAACKELQEKTTKQKTGSSLGKWLDEEEFLSFL
jgi:hypothetical protein